MHLAIFYTDLRGIVRGHVSVGKRKFDKLTDASELERENTAVVLKFIN